MSAAAHDAERSLLGVILEMGDKIQLPAVRALSADDFALASHQLIFGAMLALAEDGEPIDRVSLKCELERRGALEAVGGADFIDVLHATPPVSDNASFYAGEVKTDTLKRRADRAAAVFRVGNSPEAAEALSQALTEMREGDKRAPRPIVVRMNLVKPEPLNWLWRGWLPRGELVMVDGDPGLGKSTLTIDIAARLTRGRAMPGEADPGKPASVLFVAPEDDLGRVLRPRLEAAGADLSRVRTFIGHGKSADDVTAPPAIPKDLPFIARLIEEEDVALVVIDNLFQCFSAQTNSFKDQDVRRALWPITTVAKQTGAVIVAIRHLNKLAGGPALYRGGGSIGIIGAARAGLLVGRDPEDETVRVVASNKSNLAEEPSSLRFKLVSDGATSRVEWLGACTLKPADILASSSDPAERGAQDEACTFLLDVLSGGPLSATEVQRQARGAGISDRTLQRARSRLGVRREKEGFSGKWVLSLPTDPETTKIANQTGLAAFGLDREKPSPNGSEPLGFSVSPEDRQREDRQGGLAGFEPGGT